jgi:hypothetical protein
MGNGRSLPVDSFHGVGPADPGTGVPATSGVEPYSGAPLDGGRRRDQTNRRPEPVDNVRDRTDADHAERRTASAASITQSTRTNTNTIIPTSTKPSSVCEGFTTQVMNPLSCGDDAPVTNPVPLQIQNK